MEKELSKKLTEIYLKNSSDVNQTIDNLREGLVVVVEPFKVTVYSSLKEAIENVSYLQNKDNLTALKESRDINIDDLYICITRN